MIHFYRGGATIREWSKIRVRYIAFNNNAYSAEKLLNQLLLAFLQEGGNRMRIIVRLYLELCQFLQNRYTFHTYTHMSIIFFRHHIHGKLTFKSEYGLLSNVGHIGWYICDSNNDEHICINKWQQADWHVDRRRAGFPRPSSTHDSIFICLFPLNFSASLCGTSTIMLYCLLRPIRRKTALIPNSCSPKANSSKPSFQFVMRKYSPKIYFNTRII